MRNKLLLIGTFTVFLNSIVLAQAPYWKLNGNPNSLGDAVNATNNFLGTTTANNLAIKIGTQGRQRIYIDNTNGGVLGNVGIGSLFNSTSFRPYSNLHIAQDHIAGIGGGARNWMAPSASGTPNGGTGVLISNGDNVWLGLQSKGVWDSNDAVLSWGDNGGAGTDYFRFILTHWNLNNAPGGTNAGLEVMRFDPNSNVGIGDFQINGQLSPQSKLHIHEDLNLHPGGGNGQSVWFQMTNQDFAPTPTGNNGLKIGLLFQTLNQRTGNAFIYNQENRHLIFSTNHVAPNGPGSINTTLERMRITSIGAPTTTPTGYGVYNPGNIANLDLTRVAISHNPSNPVTRPMSLLHLGYNTDGTGTPADLGGWRSWMDVGTFTNQSFGGFGGMSLYSGLKIKPAPNPAGEAVISWGYNPTSNTGVPIPTRMRFLFTTNANATTISGSTNGIEVAHFWSDGNNTRMGVGDMQTSGVDPQNTLEILSSTASPYFATGNASGLRFTNLTSADAVVTTNGVNSSKVLTVDQNGDVVLTNAATGIGNICSTTPINPLANNWEIIMQNRNYIFRDNELGSVGIGAITGCAPANTLEISANGNSAYGANNASGLRLKKLTSASNIVANGTNGVNSNKILTVDQNGDVVLTSPAAPIGVLGNYCANPTNPLVGDYSVPLNGNSFNFRGLGTVNIGTVINCSNPNAANLYVRNSATNSTPNAIRADYFPSSLASGNAILAQASASTPNTYAGNFNGFVFVANGPIQFSDVIFKKSISEISNATQIIQDLQPHEYYMDTTNVYGYNFSGKKQYGFIAQEVETVLPELVKEVHKEAEYDSTGTMISQAGDFKGLNYTNLIAILTKGMQEQQAQIKRQDSIIGVLAQNLNSCCSQNARTQTPNTMDIELSDKDVIVLNQNVPNPFAEQTSITYNIPEKSGFAQIIFNDMKGQIIKVIDIKTKGKGQLNVFANDLSTGMYSYSLFVDGKLADTKKMVKTE